MPYAITNVRLKFKKNLIHLIGENFFLFRLHIIDRVCKALYEIDAATLLLLGHPPPSLSPLLPGILIPGTRYGVLPGTGCYCLVNSRHHPVITYWVAGLWYIKIQMVYILELKQCVCAVWCQECILEHKQYVLTNVSSMCTVTKQWN